MKILNFLLLIFLQFLSGFGLIIKIDKNLSRFTLLPISLLAGASLGTFIIYLMGILSIPIKWLYFLILFTLLTLLLLLPYNKTFSLLKTIFFKKFTDIKIYELLTVFFILQVYYISAWRTYYQPIISFDAICGIDLFAKNAIKDGKLVCWIFDGNYIKNLSTQAYYAPFTAFQQIIYRFAGFEVGQIWLSMIFLSLIIFMYHSMKSFCHPALAGFIVYITITIPEFYAYTFILQTDFSNSVFIAIAVFYFAQFWKTNLIPKLYLSGLFFAFSVWSRSESIFFIPFFSILVMYKLKNLNLISNIKHTSFFSAVSIAPFILWNIIFYRFYFPNAPQTSEILKIGNYSISSISSILSEFNKKVIFEDDYWGYFIYVVLAMIILDIVVFRKINGYIFLIAIFIFYITFILLEMHFVHFNIEYTFRRGFFKFLLVGSYYLIQSELIIRISNWLYRFEKNI